MATLAALPSLTRLDLADNPGLASLHALTALARLRVLDVGDCQLADAHVAGLLATLQLQEVTVAANPQMTGAALEALAAGPSRSSLRVLRASQLRVADGTLEPLLPLVRSTCVRVGWVAGAGLQGHGRAPARAAAEAAPLLAWLVRR